MYQTTYHQIQADSPADARAHERAILDRAVGLLRSAESSDASTRHEALTFTTQLWSVFIKDLAHPANDLPPELRANLMSVGLWVMAEVCRIEDGKSQRFAAIADVCSLIRDGLN